MKNAALLFFGILLLTSSAVSAPPANIAVVGVLKDRTAFIGRVDMVVTPADALKEIRFSIRPKPFSATRPISASFSATYLWAHGLLELRTGRLKLPLFGLYANYTNSVDLISTFTSGLTQQTTIAVTTQPYDDPTFGILTKPAVIQPRSSTATLSYDFFMLKTYAAPISPVIIDTDGEVRWVGTANLPGLAAILSGNSILISNGSGITQMELDGSYRLIADYYNYGVLWTGHHNFDFGKEGILVGVNTRSGLESTVMEVSRSGVMLKMWRLADIISAAMIAGGDNPSEFVQPIGDWFHNNSNTYSRSDNTLIVSSRENFVIGLDYDSGAIKWILGDPTKQWYQFPSLRKFALKLVGSTLPPIGQHSVSIAQDGNLLLFDNGFGSMTHTPAGQTRNYSTPRSYKIDAKNMTATATWNYASTPLLSEVCSSVYEDGAKNYLINSTQSGDIIGLNSQQQIVFHYKYQPGSCVVNWNAVPIHLENLTYR